MKLKTLPIYNGLINNPSVQIADASLDGLYESSSVISYIAACTCNQFDEIPQMARLFYASAYLDIAILEMTLFILYATLARYYAQQQNDQNHHHLGCYLAVSWPYFRDLLSGLKNGRHACVNISFILQHFVRMNLYHFINPIGIGVGLLLATILVAYRHMQNKRNESIDQNEMLLEQIKKQHLIGNSIRNKIHSHSNMKNYLHLMYAGFDGLTDGIYLYGCLLILMGLGVNSILCGIPLTTTLVVISIITLISFINKLHIEYDAQNQLQLSALRCERQLLKNELEQQPLLKKTTGDNYTLNDTQKKLTEINALIERKSTLTYLDTASYRSKFLFYSWRGMLSGAKNAIIAITTISLCVSNGSLKLALGFATVIISIIYAIYLGAQFGYQQIHKQRQKLQNNSRLFKEHTAPLLIKADDTMKIQPSMTLTI